MTFDEFKSLLRSDPFDRQFTCPAHEDRTPSLSVRDGGDKILVHCHAGCSVDEVCGALGISIRDLFYDQKGGDTEIEETYPYLDENRKVLYEQVRFKGKDFRFRRVTDFGYVWGLNGCRRVLYRLPELLDSEIGFDTVYIVDGEKDADRVFVSNKYRDVGTCAPGGMNKWLPGYVKYFLDRDVIIVRDKDSDEAAQKDKDAAEVVRDSLNGIARSVKVVQAKEGKDLSDHLDAGYTLDELEEV